MLLQVFYSIRSERQLMEQVQYNLLYRWFIGLAINDAVWVPTVFTKNRERLLEHDAVIELFNHVLQSADKHGWLSGEHFSVDGTLIQAWASHKSFVRKDGSDGDQEGGSFKGQSRSNETHESAPDAKQVVPDEQTVITLGADKGYDAKEFIKACLEMGVIPHVAQNTSGRRSAVPDAIAQTDGYAVSQQKRKLIEQGFGWAKTVGGIHQVMVRGLERVD